MAHPIYDALQSMTPAERADYKAQTIRSWPGLEGRSWSVIRNGHTWTLTILSAPTYVGGLLRLDLGLTRDGVDVPLNGPFLFRNPPILVPDPAGDITGSDGSTYREDVLAAVRQMVLDAVRDAIR